MAQNTGILTKQPHHLSWDAADLSWDALNYEKLGPLDNEVTWGSCLAGEKSTMEPLSEIDMGHVVR